MFSFQKNKKGFTLIELLLVIALMVILSVAAATSAVSTQRQITFMNNFKGTLMQIQQARLDAVTQKTVSVSNSEVVPLAYGVHIEGDGASYKMTTFGDLDDDTQGLYNVTTDPTISEYKPLNIYNNYVYTVDFCDGNTPECPLDTKPASLTIFYDPPYAEFSYTYAGKPIAGSIFNDYIKLKIQDKNYPNLKKCIVISTKSGIAEAFEEDSIYASLGLTCL